MKPDLLGVPVEQFPTGNENPVGSRLSDVQPLNGQDQRQHDRLVPLPFGIGHRHDVNVSRSDARRQIDVVELKVVRNHSIEDFEDVCLGNFVRPIGIIDSCLGSTAQFEEHAQRRVQILRAADLKRSRKQTGLAGWIQSCHVDVRQRKSEKIHPLSVGSNHRDGIGKVERSCDVTEQKRPQRVAVRRQIDQRVAPVAVGEGPLKIGGVTVVGRRAVVDADSRKRIAIAVGHASTDAQCVG